MRISDWSSDVCSSDLSLPAPLTLRLDLVQLAQRGLDPGLTLPRRPLPRLRRPLAAGRRIGIHLALQLRHQILRRSQMLLQPRAPSERSRAGRSAEHTSELTSLMRIPYAVFCLKTKKEILFHA